MKHLHALKILPLILGGVMLVTGCNPHGIGVKTWSSGRTAASAVAGRTIDTTAKASEPTADDFTVSNYFGDNMIVPREKEIVIWGTAPETENGKIVSAYFKGLEGSAVITDGSWKISLNGTLAASCDKGNTLTVKGASKTVEFEDVLVGDIWILNGQSNADLTFSGTTTQSQSDMAKMYKEDLAAASDDDNIRLFRQTSTTYDTSNKYDYATYTPQDDTLPVYKWTTASKKHLSGGGANSFPVLGYYFAKYMQEANPSVPIGIITTSWGGATLQSLSSPEAIAQYPSSIATYNFYLHGDTMTDGGIYNAFISPLRNVEITGMVFFQGESEGGLGSDYDDALKIYIDDLRQKFNTNFEFMNVQLSSYGYYTGTTYIGVGIWETIYQVRFAEAALKVDGSVSDYEIIPSYDIGYKDGDGDGAHPYYKKDLAKRVADLAAVRVYGIGDAESVGFPVPSSVDYGKNKVYITYDYVGGGLTTSDGRQYVSGFEVKVDGSWYEATAVITGENEIMIEEEDEIEGVRYGSYNRYDGNNLDYVTLRSGTGNPAVPFETVW